MAIRLSALDQNFTSARNVPNLFFSTQQPIYALQTDCITIHNADPYGGDVLETILRDPALKSALPTENYTVDYLLDMRTRIQTFSQKKFHETTFVYYLCHVAPHVDMVAGYVWPTSTTPYQIVEEPTSSAEKLFSIQVDGSFYKRPMLYLLTTSTAYALSTIPTWSTDAAGVRIAPCDARMDKGVVVWSCLRAAGQTPNHMYFGISTTWYISLDGQIHDVLYSQN